MPSSTSGVGKPELDRDHALSGRVLEILQHALIAGVVGDDQAETGSRVQRDPETFDGQLPPVVRERMQHDRRVLAGFDHLVEVADRSLTYGTGQRTVDPDRLVAFQQVPADQVGRREVVVARDGDQLPSEVMGHRLDEPGLATTRRPLEDQRQALAIRGLEDGLFVAHRLVVGALRFGLRHCAILIREPGLGAHSSPFFTRFAAVFEA